MLGKHWAAPESVVQSLKVLAQVVVLALAVVQRLAIVLAWGARL